MVCKCGHNNTNGESLHLNDILILWRTSVCVCMHSDSYIITVYGQCSICIMNMMQVSYLRHSQCKVTNTERGEHHKGATGTMRDAAVLPLVCILVRDALGFSAHLRRCQEQ